MLSQNEYVLQQAKPTLVGITMEFRKLNLGAIIVPKILTRAKQVQTSLLFPSLNIALCKRDRVPRNKMINMEVTPSISNDIRRIEDEYLRDEEDRGRKKLADKMPVVDVEALESGAAKLGTKASIPSFAHTLYLSSAPTPSAEIEATED